jgi:UDP:flavonoid glycosyltransferase YjiC (YdhE family)
MNIGIVCYASLGGSGVGATELAHALARRGHEVHLISSDEPFRWRAGVPRLSFERVETPAYPLFREPQYLLALATALVRLSRDHRLDIVRTTPCLTPPRPIWQDRSWRPTACRRRRAC